MPSEFAIGIVTNLRGQEIQFAKLKFKIKTEQEDMMNHLQKSNRFQFSSMPRLQQNIS
jgi:hypothetical protein